MDDVNIIVPIGHDDGVRIAEALEAMVQPASDQTSEVTSLDGTSFAVNSVDAVGIPTYVSDVTEYSRYGLAETGWYVFARIKSGRSGVTVTDETTVEGAAGYVAEVGADHIDVAVRFDVAATSQVVVVGWGTYAEVFVFKANDLAVRNLDYRTTFYVYDLAPYATWEYKDNTDPRFVGTEYWVADGQGGYERAAVKAYDTVPTACFERTGTAYVLTTDATFQEGVTYYTESGGTYTAAEVTVGAAVTANTYYVLAYTYAPTSDTIFQSGKTYYTRSGAGTVASPYSYAEATVTAGGTVPTAYYVHSYVLTTDTTFQAGTTYYTKDGTVYTAAEVTTGEAVTENTYYVDSWEVTADTEFKGSVYFVEDGDEYERVAVMAGDPAIWYTREVTHPAASAGTRFLGTEYWQVDAQEDLGYSRAAVMAGAPIAEGEYYTHAYTLLTAAGKFAANTRYYKLVNGVYELQTVTVGGSYAKNVYYVDTWTAAAGNFVGTAYCQQSQGEWHQVAVLAGEVIPACYYVLEHAYALTTDTTFQDGTTYYVLNDDEYEAATVTTGEAVTADTYYERTDSYVPATGTFETGVTYYTESGGTYTAAQVTAGDEIPVSPYALHVVDWPQATGEYEQGVTYYVYDGAATSWENDGCAWVYDGGTHSVVTVTAGAAIPAWQVHSKVIFAGMTKNVTYRLDTVVDCPSEFVLPEVEDDDHGCWYEMRLRHSGSYSSVLVPPSPDVKVATQHTQAETKGLNMVDLHYSNVAGAKVWRFMNTHSNFDGE